MRLRRLVQTVDKLFAIFNFPLLHPAPHLLLEFGDPMPVILANNKAPHPDALLRMVAISSGRRSGPSGSPVAL